MKHASFESLGLSDGLLRALAQIGYKQPTPIQAQSVPHLLAGRDLLGIAQTGTGKTAAFSLPLLQRLAGLEMPPAPKHPRALVLAPTRELALQIGEETSAFSRHLKLSQAVVFGGVGAHPQIQALARGVDLLIATPGRLLDLMGQRHLDLSQVSVLVLDEADRLLDMGFIRDVQRIVRHTPKARQSLLFSATMPREIADLAREMLRDPIRVDVSPKTVTVDKIEQRVIMVDPGEKRWVLEHLLHEKSVTRAIVFCRTKHGANKVAKQLGESGIEAEAIHGNKSQSARQRALANFKSGGTWVLVATDIAARGIDVQGISHVINYELPHEPESYVHRIGRTGRAGAGGMAWSLCEPSEVKRLRAIERLTKRIPTEVEVELGDTSNRPKQATEARPARQRQPQKKEGARARGHSAARKGQGAPSSQSAGARGRSAAGRRQAGGGTTSGRRSRSRRRDAA